MRLTQKFILVYLFISFFVFIVGGIVSYYMFTDVVDQETDNEVSGQAMQTVKLIENNIPIVVLNEDHEMNIRVLSDTTELSESKSYYDTMAQFGPNRELIHHRKIKQVTKINGKWYQIEIHNSLLEPDDTIYGTFISTSAIYLILVVFSFLVSFVLSRLLLKPFNEALDQIENFNIQKGIGFEPKKVDTAEFKKLNEFLKKMTDRAIKDYRNLREFSENTAHEIKTPLAIASGKLDLLIQSKNMNDEHLGLITEAQNAIKKISKIQTTLGILSKIENEEFSQTENIDFNTLIEKICEEHTEIIEFRKIKLDMDLSETVSLKNDPVLLDMLFTNLLQNAIKHNIDKKGFVKVELKSDTLVMTNSGNEISTSTEKMLDRFKKESSNDDSLGLGLAIVKNICERSGYNLSYQFISKEKVHKLTVTF